MPPRVAPAQPAAPASVARTPAEAWAETQRLAQGRTADEIAVGALGFASATDDEVTLRLLEPEAQSLVTTRRKWLRGAMADALGRPIRITILGIDDEDKPAAVGDASAGQVHEAMKHPVVQQAAELFDASVTRIVPRLAPDPGPANDEPSD